MINSVIQQGALGMQQSQARMLTNAQDIAGSVKPVDVAADKLAPPAPSLEEAMLDLQQNRMLFDASAKVFSAGSQALGRLLDTSA
ncbi:MAG: hypothetical protein RL497_1593 [Pseudomonadota bacterium]|jgi:hypothetical protein